MRYELKEVVSDDIDRMIEDARGQKKYYNILSS